MRIVEFRRLFDDQNAARVDFETERNRVLGFMVQLECLFGEEWHPVVRYDTAHGFAHRDILRPSGETEKSATPVRDYNEALTFAIQDLGANWGNYRQRYEQWLKR